MPGRGCWRSWATRRRPWPRSTIPSPRSFNTPEIRVDAGDDVKFRIVDAIRDHYKKILPVIDIDGARVKFPHGWALVRASNTQPALVVRFEADTAEELQKIQDQVDEVIRGVQAKIGS